MISGVGEAPCAIVWHGGHFAVSSWRDHQVEGYTLTPRGAGFTASMQPLLVGGDAFRPVGLAFAPDGSLFVTDWGSGSYAINGKGRVWKVILPPTAAAPATLQPTPALDRAEHLRESKDRTDLLKALDDPDPVIAQAAQYALSRLPATEKFEWSELHSPRQRVGVLAARLWRGDDLRDDVNAALLDPDDRVRQMAVRVITEQGIKESRQALAQSLDAQAMSPRLLGMTVAAINLLDGDPRRASIPAKSMVFCWAHRIATINRSGPGRRAAYASGRSSVGEARTSEGTAPILLARASDGSSPIPLRRQQSRTLRPAGDDCERCEAACPIACRSDGGTGR